MNQRIIALFSLALSFTQIQTAVALENNQHIAPYCAAPALSEAKSYDLQQFKGKVVYVDFWAS